MAKTNRKTRLAMIVIFTVLALASAISFIIEGIGKTSLLLTSFSLLALFLAITAPKQLQDFMDTLLD